MKQILFIILFIPFLELFAQNYVEVYSNSIPKSILSNKEFSEQVNESFIYYAQLNPELIYTYIQYLNKRFGDKIMDKDSNYFNLLNALNYKYKVKRNNWVLDEIKNLAKLDITFIEKREIENIYNDLYLDLTNEYDSTEFKNEDKNKRYYYIYEYLIESGNFGYEENRNYIDLVKEEYSKKVNYFNSIYDSGIPENYDKNNLIEEAKKFEYLFKNSYLDNFNEKIKVELYEFVNWLIHDSYKQENSVYIFLRGPFSPYRFKYSDDFYKLAGGIGLNPPVKFSWEMKIQPSISFGAGFKLILNSDKSIFSFIDFNGGVSIFNTIIDDNYFEQHNIDHFLMPNPPVRGQTWHKFKMLGKEDLSYLIFDAQITTPLYFFNENFFVDGGVHLSYIKISYNYAVERLTGTDPAYDISSISKEHSDSFIYPVCAINYYLTDWLDLKAEYVTNIYFKFGVNVNLVRF